jgi:uncharacterized membrane-anchored protein
VRLSLFALSLAVWCLAHGEALAQRKIDFQAYKALSKPGPMTANLGGVAEIKVPAGYRFVDKANIKKFNDLENELTSPLEVGAVFPEVYEGWYIIFSYNSEGYVKDDEKDKLDANKILADLREGQEEENKLRQREGKVPLTLPGWEKPPFFDDQTKNLTWGLQVKAQGQPGYSVNYQARILGRGGYMSANLVTGPEQLAENIPIFNNMLKDFAYKDGQKYSDWKPGDKVAAVGLTALIGGGALALAAKSGWLGKLLKPLIIGVVAVFSAIGAFFKKLFGRGESAAPSAE